MKDADAALYEAFRSKDSRFDGKFFVGVTSTGIYCRPVCRARMPKAEHCVFFHTAAEAEKAGFRPCLLCRPELAPGLSATDAQSALAKRAARYLEEHCDENEGLEQLAAKLGYTGRHLRRVFAEEFHVSPLAYRQTCQLLLAKSLLTDTGLSVLDVAMASGVGSLRRFNDLFQKRYQLSPTGLRRQARAGKRGGDTLTVALGYQPPYEWSRILRFLAQRAIPGVEAATDDRYSRTVRLPGKDGGELLGWFTVRNRPEKNVLTVTLSESLLPVLARVLGRVRNLFDLHCEPLAVSERLSAPDSGLPGGFVCGLRVPGCFDPFELSVRAILGQQISVKAASALAGRLANALGTPVQTDVDGLTRAFPTAGDMAALDGRIEDCLCPLGMVAARARAIQALAVKVSTGELDFELCGDSEAARKKLTALPGIGDWTAAYIALRALGDTDAFPETDLGIRKALGNRKPKEIRELAERWRPWRSYATLMLWDSLHTEEKP